MTWRSTEKIRGGMLQIWKVMAECIQRELATQGELRQSNNSIRAQSGSKRRDEGRDEIVKYFAIREKWWT
jgi:L-serine deaminase